MNKTKQQHKDATQNKKDNPTKDTKKSDNGVNFYWKAEPSTVFEKVKVKSYKAVISEDGTPVVIETEKEKLKFNSARVKRMVLIAYKIENNKLSYGAAIYHKERNGEGYCRANLRNTALSRLDKFPVVRSFKDGELQSKKPEEIGIIIRRKYLFDLGCSNKGTRAHIMMIKNMQHNNQSSPVIEEVVEEEQPQQVA